jgi:predicted DNA-binding ArsR family transcriptional regulator
MGWFDSDSVTAVKALSKKLDQYLTTTNGRNIMGVLEDLGKAVSDLVADVKLEQDEVSVAVDTIKQLVEADVNVSTTVRSAVANLVDAHDKLAATTKKLKDETDSIMVSGGIVYPKT